MTRAFCLDFESVCLHCLHKSQSDRAAAAVSAATGNAVSSIIIDIIITVSVALMPLRSSRI